MKNAVTTAEMIQVPIDSIVVGVRRREKLGRVKTLAASIAEHGLIHPILLRGETLIAGHRRLEACKSLHWKTIPARQVARLSDDELRAIEVDENSARENLSTYETSKARLAQIRQAEADVKARAKTVERVSVARGHKNPKPNGRPKGTTAGSLRSVEEETGISPREQQRVERHVEIADRYPFMQRTGWLRTHVLDAGDKLEQLPPYDRSGIAAMLDQPGIPPGDAINYIEHAVTMPAAKRKTIIERSTHADEFVRRSAMTELAAVPPPPDPGLLALHAAAGLMEKAATVCRSSAFKPTLADLSCRVGDTLKAFSAHEKEARSHV